MTYRNRLRAPGYILAAITAVLAASNGGCTAVSNAVNDVQQASEGCSGLQPATSSAQATVQAWVNSLTALNTAANNVEA